jgi:phenylacetate-coenzyme A ligase PaaK-like adenylate-forming protein
MSQNALQEFASEMAAIVRRTRRNFKWYDEMLDACGYDQDAQPARLPFIDEAILNQYYYNASHPQFGDCQVYLTSGTANGERKRILFSTEDHESYVDQRRQIFSHFISADCKSACSDLGTGHAASSASEVFQQLGLESFQIDFRSPIQEHLEGLNNHRPDVLFTMPVILNSIIQTGALKHHPKKIIVVGDVATQSWKQGITNYFGLNRTDLLDVVGSIEIGAIAHQCFDCGLFHLGPHLIAETIHPSVLLNDPDYPGVAEVLVLTSTTRSVFPAVRFVTNDLVEGFTKHLCRGETIYGFERIIGRIGNEWKNGEKISIYDITEAVNKYLPGGLFEIHKGPSRLVIKVCSREFTRGKAEEIKSFIKQSNPNLNQMIASELVDDIEVWSVKFDELLPRAAKATFLIDG